MFLSIHACLRAAPQAVLLCLALSAALPARALPLSDGSEFECQVSRDGRTGPATEKWVQYERLQDRDPELGKAVAVVRHDERGWPVIFIDAVAHKRGRLTNAGLWDFVFLHECAHARDPKFTEIEANCEAYLEMERRGLMNPIRLKDIEAAHLQILNLPQEYGGNGIEFWRRTLACVQAGNGAGKSAIEERRLTDEDPPLRP